MFTGQTRRTGKLGYKPELSEYIDKLHGFCVIIQN